MADLSALPAHVQGALEGLDAAFQSLAPASELVLFGSVVRGGYNAERSNVDLMVVLEVASEQTLEALAEPLRDAFLAARVECFLLQKGELANLADVFPVRTRDILRAHRVLRGADPCAGVSVQNAPLRLRVEQELRNMLLRLRRDVISRGATPRDAHQGLLTVARRLPFQVDALLELCGFETQGTHRDILKAATQHFDFDPGFVAALSDLRERKAPSDWAPLRSAALRTLAQLVKRADTLEIRS